MSTWTTLLITGLRGNAKTLLAVKMIDDFAKAGTPVYVSNLNGLKYENFPPGMVQPFADPRDWETLPAGSVLFVDEAQRFWRARPGSAKIGDEVVAMETQRHTGVRMVLITQQPTFLDKHVRLLVDSHMHLVRRAGLPASQVYTWERCKDEPEAPATLELADKTVLAHPTEYFGWYTSAEEHHIKRKMPMRAKMMIAGLVLAVCGFAWAVSSLRHDSTPAAAVVEGEGAGSDAVAPASSRSDRRARQKPRTTAELVAALKPRIAAAPWSAPIYDDALDVGDPPEIACSIGHAGIDANGDFQEQSCHCITTQGTDYELSPHDCERVVWNGGIINPYKKRKPENLAQRSSGDFQPSAVEDGAPAPEAAIGAGDATNLQQPYGGMRPSPAT